jgi:hypothetical protein
LININFVADAAGKYSEHLGHFGQMRQAAFSTMNTRLCGAVWRRPQKAKPRRMSVSHNKRSVALSFKEIQELLAEAANATDQHAEAGPGSHRSDTGGGGTSGTVTPAISRPTSLVLQKQPSLVMHRRAGKLGSPWVPDPGTAAAAAWLPGASVERPPLVQRRLEKRCRKALQLLDQLQQPVFNLAKGGNVAPLPPAALRFCKVGVAAPREGPQLNFLCSIERALHSLRRRSEPNLNLLSTYHPCRDLYS